MVLRADVRELLAAVVREALADLASRHGMPELDVQFDPWTWERQGQESFAVRRRMVWRQPVETYSSEWFEGLKAMRSLRATVRAEEDLSQRLDTMVGTEFWRSHRSLPDIVRTRLLTPLIIGSREYKFDAEMFTELYSALERRLFATKVRYIDWVPINGVVLASGVVVEFPDGSVLREMTDAEVGAAIGVLAVPVERHDSPTSVTISRINQVALTLEHEHPFVAERDVPQNVTFPQIQAVDEPAARLVTALRIVCGGSSGATRSLRMLHPDELEANGSPQAQLTPLGTIDAEQPAILFADQTAELLRVCELLGRSTPAALQVALRRLTFAGSRTQAVDRLIDLTICAEALFIQHLGSPTSRKSDAVVEEAMQLLGSDPVLGATPDEIEKFMRAAYRRRNAEVHGDPLDRAPLLNLRGEPAPRLETVVEDLDRVMRRACRRVVEVGAASEVQAPTN